MDTYKRLIEDEMEHLNNNTMNKGERAALDNAPRYFVARTLPVSGEPVISSVMRVPFSQDVQNGYIVLNISID